MNEINTINDIPKSDENSQNQNQKNNTINIQKINNSNTQENKDLDSLINIPSHRRNLIFVIFLLSNLFLNYDTGVIPASLLEILKEIPLDYTEQALLGSLVYLGLSFSSLFVSLIFSKYGPAKVCSIILILNSFSCFCFSLNSNKYILFLMRFLMGATEAFIVIYGPVWVNNYSPAEFSTTWMGLIHTCSLLGVVLGYILTGIIINFLGDYVSWRFAIQIQGFVEIFFSIFFYFEKDEYINVDLNYKPPSSENESNIENVVNKKPIIKQLSYISKRSRIDSRIDTIETSNLSKYCYQAKTVLTNSLYLTTTMGLCSIYFIVTGIQFWMTEYMIGILHIKPVVVVVVFSIVSVTAPLFGVLVGSTFADSYGGYKGKNTVDALKICLAFGFISFVFSFPMGFLYDVLYLAVLLWTFLFFGAACIPIGTGIMISSVRKDCQATSSSLSQLIFNLLGYFLSPILTGFVMDCFEEKRMGFIWGMRVVYWWVIFAVVYFMASFIIAYKKYEKYKDDENDEKDLVEDDDGMEKELREFMQLEIKRRLAQNNTFI